MFALPISMPRFKSINFYQSRPKSKLFLQYAKIFDAKPKMQTLEGASAPLSSSFLGQTIKTN